MTDTPSTPAPTGAAAGGPADAVSPARGGSRYGTPIQNAASASVEATPDVAPDPTPQAAAPEAVPAAATASDTPETTDVQDAPTTEPAADEALATEEAQALDGASLSAEMIRRAIPGAVVETDEQAEVYVRQLAREADGMSDLRATLQEVPELATFFRALGEGSAPRLAAIDAFRELASAPDPDDPEYPDWLRAEGARTERRRMEQERTAERNVQRNRRDDAMEASLNAFAQRYPDVDTEALREHFHTLNNGDRRTGNFRGDAYEIVHLGMNHQTILADAVTEARADEREKVLAQVRGEGAATQEGDELLALGDGGGAGGVASIDPSTLSPAERRRLELAGTLLGNGGARSRYGTGIRPSA
ncbi:MAG: hypothetical protein Rubg2KO_15480 [Rubricoccaceae bacterium]